MITMQSPPPQLFPMDLRYIAVDPIKHSRSYVSNVEYVCSCCNRKGLIILSHSMNVRGVCLPRYQISSANNAATALASVLSGQ